MNSLTRCYRYCLRSPASERDRREQCRIFWRASLEPADERVFAAVEKNVGHVDDELRARCRGLQNCVELLEQTSAKFLAIEYSLLQLLINQQLQQAVLDREELRARLLQQFNAILVTHDTARGLVVNMSDVLFDSGKYTLRPLAREKLAKISGIVLAYPSLRLAIEGNTDSIGSEEFNQNLSEQRAEGVRSYLTQQGVPESSTSARGYGKNQPIASNDTADGRQQNRRVELVVSGDVIGSEIGKPAIQPIAGLSPR